MCFNSIHILYVAGTKAPKRLHSFITPRKNINASDEPIIMVTEKQSDVSGLIDLNNNTTDQSPALSSVGSTMSHATTSWSLTPQTHSNDSHLPVTSRTTSLPPMAGSLSTTNACRSTSPLPSTSSSSALYARTSSRLPDSRLSMTPSSSASLGNIPPSSRTKEEGSKKKTRQNFSKAIQEVFIMYLFERAENYNVTDTQKDELETITGVKRAQINQWFENARRDDRFPRYQARFLKIKDTFPHPSHQLSLQSGSQPDGPTHLAPQTDPCPEGNENKSTFGSLFRDIMNARDEKERKRRKTAYEELPNDPSKHMLHVLLATRYFIVLLCIQLYTYKTKYTRT